jgi:transcriptional regulator with XRE-family HTH domain
MPSPAEIVSANLRFLMGEGDGRKTQASVGKAAEIDQRTVGRIINMEHAPTLTQVVKLAEAFKVEPWQLLTPGLGADLYRIVENRIVPVLSNRKTG